MRFSKCKTASSFRHRPVGGKNPGTAGGGFHSFSEVVLIKPANPMVHRKTDFGGHGSKNPNWHPNFGRQEFFLSEFNGAVLQKIGV
jgi:hypothetical protein